MGIDDFFALACGDVERVHGHALVRADPRVSGVESVLIDGVEKIVKQPDAVQALDLHGGASGVDLVAHVCADGDGDAVIRAWFKEICFAAEIFFGVVTLGGEDRFEGVKEPLASGSCGDGFEVRCADAEDVHDDAVLAGEEICGENVDLFRGERAADFF